MKSSKKIALAVLSGKIPAIFDGNGVFISRIDLNREGVEFYTDVYLTNVKRFKWLGINIFVAETDDYIYYVMTKKESRFNKYLAFSEQIPKKGQMYPCTRLLYNYAACWEDRIVTSPVKRVKKISEGLYKVKTRHEYFVVINQEEDKVEANDK